MKWVRIVFIIVVLAATAALASHAFSHDVYSDKTNRAGDSCCGGHDCRPYDAGRVTETADEFIVDGKWRFNKDDAMPSWDAQFHACITGGKPRCFWFPSNV